MSSFGPSVSDTHLHTIPSHRLANGDACHARGHFGERTAMRAVPRLRYLALLIPAVAGPLGAQDRLLAPGNPPLTAAGVTVAAQFYEWALDVRLNEAQYREFERLLVDRWKQSGGAAEILR